VRSSTYPLPDAGKYLVKDLGRYQNEFGNLEDG
jgi:hypothetical protein